MRLRPVHAQRAAVHQHHHQRLACAPDRFQQSFLRFGQVETGAVAAQKARLADRHLLALELARDSHHRDHNVGFPGCGQSFGRRRRRCIAPTAVARVACLRRIGHTSQRWILSGPCSRCTLPSFACAPSMLNTCAISLPSTVTLRKPVRRNAQQIVARFRRRQKSRPLHRQRGLALRLRRQIVRPSGRGSVPRGWSAESVWRPDPSSIPRPTA